METEIILKKKDVQLVRRRLKELLKPFGFQTHPHSTNRLVRVREDFIDEISLDATGYHLDPCYYTYSYSAPFAWLKCDQGRLWRTAKENITTHLAWHCTIPPEGGPYYYTPEHFEAVWQDIVYVLEHHILPQMVNMTTEKFLSRLVDHSSDDRDLFRPHRRVSFTDLYFTCMSEAAVYGVEMWRQQKYEEGVPYLVFAQTGYRSWMALDEHENAPFYPQYALILSLLDELMSIWKNKDENWTLLAQERIRQIAVNWEDYII